MSIHAVLPHPPGPHISNQSSHLLDPAQNHVADRGVQARVRRSSVAPIDFRFPSQSAEESTYRQAELFYLQKQIQSQTPMVIVLEDGEKIEGCIEWYDRNSLKVRGRAKTLVYKSAIKYMYKVGEQGR
jgi:sRNA-binding regulator protein Hfq